MQDQGKEDVRFSRDAVGKLEASRGVGSGSLWGVVELWKNFLDARAQAAGRRVQQDVQNRLIKYLSEKNGGSGDKQLPQSVNLSELPADLQRDVRTLRDEGDGRCRALSARRRARRRAACGDGPGVERTRSGCGSSSARTRAANEKIGCCAEDAAEHAGVAGRTAAPEFRAEF